MTFGLCWETLKPQLDHTDPSYQAALARCQRAAQGAAAHPDGLLTPFGLRAITPERAPILPDPPGAQRRAQSARPRRTGAGPQVTRALALLKAHGRPATADDLAPGDQQIAYALKNGTDSGYFVSRQIGITGRRRGGRRSLYALPGMAWPDLPPGRRYLDADADPLALSGPILSKTQVQQRRRQTEARP
jgi:hypothetical protein